jgi:oligopeptide/dipeptide ABC transporter ATP-binding protein
VEELFSMVGIPEPKRRLKAFPHELSGGMAQRVMIAMALACVPELLIADEPTTALDVTIQAQILDLMRDLRTKVDTSIILITHDMGVVAEMADRVAVMYAGRIVEQAAVNTLFNEPLHPYTQGLLAAIPIHGVVQDRLAVIRGTVPNLIDLPPGCKFAPRCDARIEHGLTQCTEEEPHLISIHPGHTVRCWLYE